MSNLLNLHNGLQDLIFEYLNIDDYIKMVEYNKSFKYAIPLLKLEKDLLKLEDEFIKIARYSNQRDHTIISFGTYKKKSMFFISKISKLIIIKEEPLTLINRHTAVKREYIQKDDFFNYILSAYDEQRTKNNIFLDNNFEIHINHITIKNNVHGSHFGFGSCDFSRCFELMIKHRVLIQKIKTN